ncbi:MerR family transcriptional regulator [Nonomuraea sp. NPDC050790]|uniref:MerR family transcriptional regulator n=1 Tax=Nonomuraea sp. NPDC050790 TaxID=3364371 RepID=UPI003787C8F0
MKIGELANRLGLRPSTLRHWNTEGLLTPTTRVNSQREYSSRHVIRGMTIIRAQAAGMTLQQIRAVLDRCDDLEHRPLLAQHLVELDRHVHEVATIKALIEHVMRCTVDDFARCLHYQRLVQSVSDSHSYPPISRPFPQSCGTPVSTRDHPQPDETPEP